MQQLLVPALMLMMSVAPAPLRPAPPPAPATVPAREFRDVVACTLSTSYWTHQCLDLYTGTGSTLTAPRHSIVLRVRLPFVLTSPQTDTLKITVTATNGSGTVTVNPFPPALEIPLPILGRYDLQDYVLVTGFALPATHWVSSVSVKVDLLNSAPDYVLRFVGTEVDSYTFTFNVD